MSVERKTTLQARRSGVRPRPKKLLIVCEDSKSGFYYLDDLVVALQLSTVAVVKPSEQGTDPWSVVEFAKKSLQQGEYDEVCAVFDGDGILRSGPEKAQFDNAITKAGAKPAIDVYVSVPCIEYWFLLHYGFTDTPDQECDSICNRLSDRINRKYCKSIHIYPFLPSGGQSQAIRHAQKLRSDSQRFSCPSTEVDLLIENLLKRVIC
ncbi:MAG: RloB domain-containing protein [Magnetococcales bacterium]|nr:RloB domain-containing protein [Magnetococcales bacterium]